MKVLVGSVLAAGMLLSGCKEESSARRAAQDAQDIAMVERLSKEPFKPIIPKPITEVDMTRYGLERVSCAFRKQGESDPVFLAGSDEGFMRIAGDLKRFAAKTESAQLPGDARSTYIGLSSWVDFIRQADGGDGGSQDTWPARMIIHDSQERVAFMSDGTMTCSPSTQS